MNPPVLCRDGCGLVIGDEPGVDHAVGEPLRAICAHCGSRRTVHHAEIADLDIAHVDCDAFYAAVEKRDDPSLADKPLIVGHPGGRGVVTTACYIARRSGPRSAMPMFKALKLCPDAVVIKPDMAKYKAVSASIRAIFGDATDTIEPVSLDEAYLDLTPDCRLRPAQAPAEALAEIARRVEREVGITVSIGLSYNKFLAKLASDLDKPRGFSVVGRAEAKAFLAGLPVKRIHGVGAATEQKMARLGITDVAQLQAMDERTLVAHFGRFGRRLAQFVRGVDERQVTSHRPAKSVSAETTFGADLHRFDDLMARLEPLAVRVAERLARGGIAGRTVVLKLKTSDFQILTRNRRMGRPVANSSALLAAGRALLAREVDGRSFRLIGLGVADLEDPEVRQPDLFGG